MAEKKSPRRVKKTETVRERSQRKDNPKPRRIKTAVTAAKKPITAAQKKSKKEYHLIKLPDNKLGRFLSKRVHFMPKYFRNAWAEVKQVSWPNARETMKLTTAVLVFAVVLGGLVWVLDYGLNKLFREILIG